MNKKKKRVFVKNNEDEKLELASEIIIRVTAEQFEQFINLEPIRFRLGDIKIVMEP